MISYEWAFLKFWAVINALHFHGFLKPNDAMKRASSVGGKIKHIYHFSSLFTIVEIQCCQLLLRNICQWVIVLSFTKNETYVPVC